MGIKIQLSDLKASKIFQSGNESIQELDQFIEEFTKRTGVGRELQREVKETFLKISEQAYPNTKGTIVITLSFFKNERIEVDFLDHGIPYNPSEGECATYERDNESNLLKITATL